MRCRMCKGKAEFFVPDADGKPRFYLCERHAVIYMKRYDVNFLPAVQRTRPSSTSPRRAGRA